MLVHSWFEKSEIPSIISSNSNPINIAGIDFKKPAGSLKTEVGILESSSVLMPVFDYVRNQKGKNVKYHRSDSMWSTDYIANSFFFLLGVSRMTIKYLRCNSVEKLLK